MRKWWKQAGPLMLALALTFGLALALTLLPASADVQYDKSGRPVLTAGGDAASTSTSRNGKPGPGNLPGESITPGGDATPTPTPSNDSPWMTPGGDATPTPTPTDDNWRPVIGPGSDGSTPTPTPTTIQDGIHDNQVEFIPFDPSDKDADSTPAPGESTPGKAPSAPAGGGPAAPEVPLPPAAQGREIVKWIERVELPAPIQGLYDWLVESSGGDGQRTPCLTQDQPFTLASGGSAVQGQEVLGVECADFELAELFAGGEASLGTASFESEDFYQVSAGGDKQVDYAALKMGDVVRTSTFNGVYVTRTPRDAKFDESKKTIMSYISTAYQAFDRDCPEVFWLSGKCRVRIPSVKGADGAQWAYFFLVLADEDGFDMRAPDWTAEGAVPQGIKRREKAVEAILGAVTAEAPAEIVRELNRWLTEHNQYNTTPDLTTIGNEPHECLSALEGRIDRDGPVCDGYSRAFKVLCDRLDIPCVLENGYARTTPDSKGGLHMWNAARISGQWYGVDVTWNDPTVKGFVGAKSGKENEQFLLVGADTIVRGMAFADSHPATNRASEDGVAFDNGPSLSAAAFSAVTANGGLAALPFVDVAEDAWYYDSVAYVYEENLMMGTAADRFSPGGATTRQQLWMILARMDGEHPQTMDAARVWAVDEGISDGTNPGGQLTREQLVTMLYRYCQLAGRDVSASASLSGFADAGTVSGYARQAMSWAVAENIVTGMGDAIAPHVNATRAQLAAILERL